MWSRATLIASQTSAAAATRRLASAAGRSGAAAWFPTVPRSRPLAARAPLRCLASKSSKSSGDDKSWSEIASEAVGVGKDLIKKVGSTVGKAVEALTPSGREERRIEQRERRRREELEWPAPSGGGLLGNLVGRAVGGLVGGALREMGNQMRQAAEQAQEVQSRAAAIIETSSKVRDRLGADVRVGPPMSQSSMTQIINGRRSNRVTLLLPVASSRGQAQAEVSFVEEAGQEGAGDFNIRLRLPSGEVLNVDVEGGSSYAAGRTIDVEWKEL